jgi:lipopolysaccharide export system protein LptC
MSSPTAEPGVRFSTRVPPGLAAEDIQRRRQLLQQWQRHSNLIRALRKVMPVLCIGMLVLMAGWAAINTLYWRLGAAAHKGDMAIRMLKPNFQGRDDKGQPYLLSADSALRDDGDSARITLEAPVFTLGSAVTGQTHVRAKHGVYREDSRILNLTGDVHLDDAEGYHFVTEHAVIDTQKNNVDGEQHIDGRGPLGQIAASSYAVRDGGAHVYFNGQVKARIEHHGGSGGAQPAQAKHEGQLDKR